MRRPRTAAIFVGLLALSLLAAASAQVNVKDDPLVRMPGSQPAPEGGVSLEGPNRCLNCHGGYNLAVEPGHNWMGSMMAQAARDFLFWSCLTVAAQDSMWAVGTPNATDICLRCHSPKGWLEGRSDPTNGSALIGDDFDGVQCDFCHRSYDPFFQATHDGSREGSDWLNYWDETNLSSTPSSPAALATNDEDWLQAQGLLTFNGSSLYGVDRLPANSAYDEAASGQYYVSANADKRASFADAAARHQMLYSRFHKSKYFCATCHDVSNPILNNLGADPAGILPTEQNPAYSYFHVERTFSEFMLSDYGQPGGAPGLGPFTPGVFDTSLANNYISKCQDCHMRDVVGVAANKNGVPIRPNDSVEHPLSGQPLHDLTGGNVWVSAVLASAVPGSPNYDAFNDQQLNQGAAVLTMELGNGLGIDPAALLDGVSRAEQQLQLAASIENLDYNPSNGALSFRIQNQTGHKLISGFPEGRRMFVNVKLFQGTDLIQEINPYDGAAGTLKGLAYDYLPGDEGLPDPQTLSGSESYVDELVYEMHPSSPNLTQEAETFHFALATGRYKDNRIPPKGFRISEAGARVSVPVWHGAEDASYYTAAEYAGGYDDVSLTASTGADTVEVTLYYQTTSREYIEFLRDEINGTGNLTLPYDAQTEPSPYVVQTDPFFTQLKAWGDTLWQLWTHNMNWPGAAPYAMASASWGDVTVCNAPAPTLLSATPGNQQVTVTWSDEHTADPLVVGYSVHHDQGDKTQLVADLGLTTSYTDTGLTNGQQVCYVVTSSYAGCTSPVSNVLCAVPNNQGQALAGVSALETGYYSGKGKNQSWIAISTIAAGEAVVVRAWVVDASTGLPIEGATVALSIEGPETTTLTSGQTDATGMAEATWQTQAPNKRGQGGTTPGSYSALVTGVAADGYTWDGAATTVAFTLE